MDSGAQMQNLCSLKIIIPHFYVLAARSLWSPLFGMMFRELNLEIPMKATEITTNHDIIYPYDSAFSYF